MTIASGEVTHELSTLVDQYLLDYFAFYPTVAASLGLHEYDGRLCNLRPDAIQQRITQLHAYQAQLQPIAPETLSRIARFDYDMLQWHVALELWQLTDEQEYRYNPLIYAYDLMVDGYIKRDYAPLAVRAAALTRHLQAIPAVLETARANLGGNMPAIIVEESLEVYEGLTNFLLTDLDEPLQPLDDPHLRHDLWAARDQAVAALRAFHYYLKHELLPNAQPNFALGSERYAKMLRYNELIDMPLDQLLAIGEADLQRNKAALDTLARQLDPQRSVPEQMQALTRNHPAAEELLSVTMRLIEDLQAFLIERDLITLPTDSPYIVAPTPPFARWAFAMMETAGPFEPEDAPSFYYITMPEPHWSPEEVESWLTRFDYATLADVSMHEAFPGHFVHFSMVRQAPSRLAKVFATYTHYESWAHYVEQMMLEQGYDPDNQQLRMAQLAEALIRNCRYVCSIKMHTQGMSLDEATAFFMENAYMDEMTARREARRGTHDAGYLNYTLGKLLLYKVLDDYRQAMGPEFSLKRFHDEYIGYGSPPIPILRRMILPHDDGVLL